MAIVPAVQFRRDVKSFGRQIAQRARAEVRPTRGRWIKYLWRIWQHRIRSIVQVCGAIALWLWLSGIVIGGATTTAIAIARNARYPTEALFGIGMLFSVLGALWLPVLLGMSFPGHSTRAMPYYPIDLQGELRRHIRLMTIFWSSLLLAAPMIAFYIVASASAHGVDMERFNVTVPIVLRGICLGAVNSLLIMVPALAFQRFHVRWLKPVLTILGFGMAGLLVLYALRPLGAIPAEPPADPKLMMAYLMATSVDPAVLVRWLWWTPIGITQLSLYFIANNETAWGLGILVYPLTVLGVCAVASFRMNLQRLEHDLWFRESDRRTGDPAKQAAMTPDTVKDRLLSAGLSEIPDVRRGGWFGLMIQKLFSKRDLSIINLLFQGRAAWRLRWYLSIGTLALGFLGILFPKEVLVNVPAAPLILLISTLVIATVVFLPTSTEKPGLTLNKSTARRTPAFSHYPVDLTVMCRVLHRLFAYRCMVWLVVLVLHGLITHMLFGPKAHAYTIVFVSLKLLWALFWVSPIVVISSVRGSSVDPELLPIRTVLIHWPMTLCVLGAYITTIFALIVTNLPDHNAQFIANGLGFICIPLVSLVTFFAFRWYYNRFLDLTVTYQGKGINAQTGTVGRR